MLILSAVPWLFLYVGGVFSLPAATGGNEDQPFLAALLAVLNIAYIMLVMHFCHGRKRIWVTVMTILFGLIALLLFSALPSGSDAGFDFAVFLTFVFGWTLILSIVGLVLLYTPAVNTYIAELRAYNNYLVQQNTIE